MWGKKKVVNLLFCVCVLALTSANCIPVRTADQLFIDSSRLVTGSLCVVLSTGEDDGVWESGLSTNVELFSSRPFTTCWSAVWWTVVSCASENGLSNPTKRMRSPLTRGKTTISFRCSFIYSHYLKWILLSVRIRIHLITALMELASFLHPP